MIKTCKAAIGAAILAVGLSAGVAQAAPIIGSISVTDGVFNTPATPSAFAAGGLTTIVHDGNGLVDVGRIEGDRLTSISS